MCSTAVHVNATNVVVVRGNGKIMAMGVCPCVKGNQPRVTKVRPKEVKGNLLKAHRWGLGRMGAGAR